MRVIGRSSDSDIYLGLLKGRDIIWVPAAPPSRGWRTPDAKTRRLHAAEHMVIHAIEHGRSPDALGSESMTCAMCGATRGIAMMGIGLAILLLALLPAAWPIALLLWVVLVAWYVQMAVAWRAGDCERPLRGNLLVVLSRWVQHRWLVTPPTDWELQRAMVRGEQLLAALASAHGANAVSSVE